LTEIDPGRLYAIAGARDNQGYTRLYLARADGDVIGLEAKVSGQIAISADGSRIAWTTGVKNSTDTIVSVASTKSGKVIAEKRFSTVALRAGVGFAKDRIVLTNDYRALPSEVWLWDPGSNRVTRIPGTYATSTSPETGLVSIVAEVKETRSGNGRRCSVVVDTVTADNRKVWQSCDLTPIAFSPDGQYALAKPSVTNGMGIKSYTVIHLSTGSKVSEVQADLLDGARWEPGSQSFVVEVEADQTFALVRCDLDARCSLVTDPVPYHESLLPGGQPRPYLISGR